MRSLSDLSAAHLESRPQIADRGRRTWLEQEHHERPQPSYELPKADTCMRGWACSRQPDYATAGGDALHEARPGGKAQESRPRPGSSICAGRSSTQARSRPRSFYACPRPRGNRWTVTAPTHPRNCLLSRCNDEPRTSPQMVEDERGLRGRLLRSPSGGWLWGVRVVGGGARPGNQGRRLQETGRRSHPPPRSSCSGRCYQEPASGRQPRCEARRLRCAGSCAKLRSRRTYATSAPPSATAKPRSSKQSMLLLNKRMVALAALMIAK